MGYENRDYARNDFGGWSGSGSGSFRDWPVWKKIVAVNVAVFLLQIFFTRPGTLEDFVSSDHEREQLELAIEEGYYEEFPAVSLVQEWFKLDSTKVLHGQIWRLVTCGFCHARQDIFHILFNMLFLFWFGSRLEDRYGSREFAAFYFFALLASSFAYIALDLYTATMVPAIGASGAVWGVVALYALLYPHETIRIYFLFPVPIWLMAVIYFAYDIHPVLLSLSGETVRTGVAHAAHVGGAVFGFLYYRGDWQLMPWIDKLTGRRPEWANSSGTKRGNARVVPMHGPYKTLDTPDEERMDAILEKISNQGRESLSEDEEQFLASASKRLRDR